MEASALTTFSESNILARRAFPGMAGSLQVSMPSLVRCLQRFLRAEQLQSRESVSLAGWTGNSSDIQLSEISLTSVRRNRTRERKAFLSAALTGARKGSPRRPERSDLFSW